MTVSKHEPGYVPNDAFTQADWDEVSDNPELTDEELARLRTAQEVLPPALFAGLVNRGGRPRAAIRKVPVTLRVDPAILDAYKATGDGWQTRMHAALVRGLRGSSPKRQRSEPSA